MEEKRLGDAGDVGHSVYLDFEADRGKFRSRISAAIWETVVRSILVALPDRQLDLPTEPTRQALQRQDCGIDLAPALQCVDHRPIEPPRLASSMTLRPWRIRSARRVATTVSTSVLTMGDKWVSFNNAASVVALFLTALAAC
jgi:hypothetical protein